MYINRKRASVSICIWSAIFVPAFTMLFAVIGTAVEYGEIYDFPVLFTLGVICVVLIFFYVRTLVYQMRIAAMERVFQNDEDGVVPADELAKYLNISEAKLRRIRIYGERKRLLINCVFDAENNRYVLTDRYDQEKAVGTKPFVGMSCPGCAAPLKIRAGSTGTCPFCGRDVTAPDIVVEEHLP